MDPRWTPGRPRWTQVAPGGPRVAPGGPRVAPGGPRAAPGGPRVAPGGPRVAPGRSDPVPRPVEGPVRFSTRPRTILPISWTIHPEARQSCQDSRTACESHRSSGQDHSMILRFRPWCRRRGNHVGSVQLWLRPLARVSDSAYAGFLISSQGHQLFRDASSHCHHPRSGVLPPGRRRSAQRTPQFRSVRPWTLVGATTAQAPRPRRAQSGENRAKEMMFNLPFL